MNAKLESTFDEPIGLTLNVQIVLVIMICHNLKELYFKCAMSALIVALDLKIDKNISFGFTAWHCKHPGYIPRM